MGKFAVYHNRFHGIFILFIGLFLSSCATQKFISPAGSFQAIDLDRKLGARGYSQKVDNFLVILDASSSMSNAYVGSFPGSEGVSKFAVEKEVLTRMNQTIPALSMTSGLRSFGFNTCMDWQHTKLNYGMERFSNSGFQGGIDSVPCASGGTPMGVALDAAVDDLQSTSGDIALMVVSDGNMSSSDSLPYIHNLKHEYGDRLCVYPVWVGNTERGKSLMQQMADVGECGFFASADELASPQAMADYVEKVFLGRARVLDSDGDGVPDNKDKCPNTPTGVTVDRDGCPLDTDGDGVYDYLDKCPGTPAGATVDRNGCWSLSDEYFDTNKSVIKPEFYPLLQNAVRVLNKNPGLRLQLEGHTDNRGSHDYNMGLSQRRAEAVKDYLISEGISADRLSAKGNGYTQPIASNETVEGRARNRRVHLKVLR